MHTKTASKFSLLVFAPVLLALLLPPLFLLPSSVLLVLIGLFDPTVPFSTSASNTLWITGPILAALVLFLTGRGLYSLYLRARSPLVVWLPVWVFFSVMLFLAIWIGFTILTSVGASDIPAHEFLSMTALYSAGLTLLGQTLVIPWLFIVSRILIGTKLFLPGDALRRS